MNLALEAPSPKQVQFYRASTKHVGFGGARGGGKSHAVRTKAVLLAFEYPGIRMLIVRRTYPELVNNHINQLRVLLRDVARYNDKDKAIPAPEIIVKRDGTELGKNPGGTHYIAYFGDKLTAEVKNASDALDRKWSWLKRGDSSSICDTASLEVDISLCSSTTVTVNLTLESGDHAVTLIRNMWFKLSPPPEVTIDYENEALVAVRPDNLSLVGCNLRVGYEHPQWEAVFFSNKNKFTVPIASIQSDWPGNQAYTVQVEWTHSAYANGGPVGEAATLTIPARPAVQKPTVSAAPFTITVEGVSTGYNVRLTAADAASPDDRIAARPTVSGSDVRFTGLAENTQYKLWVQKKATGSSFRSAWGSFAVSTGTAMELVPSLTWTASYSRTASPCARMTCCRT